MILPAKFGSMVDLIGCVAQMPEPRGDCLSFVVAGEELVTFADGNTKPMAFYQRCLIERSHLDAVHVIKGQALTVAGFLHQTRNTITRAPRTEVKILNVMPIERHASDLVRDVGQGFRLRNGFQRVVLSGRAGADAQRGFVDHTAVLNVSLAVSHPERAEVNWVDVCKYGDGSDVTIARGQLVGVEGRIWNRNKILASGARTTFTAVEAAHIFVAQGKVNRRTDLPALTVTP
ncbi:hypothetical protein GO986_12385 [Deinococcus sp. HMF7620]|uniref:Single-stranded DNA-binding protein n=1 Tax=Deinococcus arboris TaxID=2682977 RepID=A0A7C9MRW7_9DEIO|nr:MULTISPECIES: hypothetical protein [Deinococcus]MBZ9752182.1 single-stranded DNA-binding protein [Deinococcus betulae]MVN87564.1 hypothetical protein [Deinococcus arboris]